MSEAEIGKLVSEMLKEQGFDEKQLELLASQLVWRVGRNGDEGPVTIRLGFASSAALFAELPRLKSATDSELEEAVKTGELRVEWVGHAPG